MIPLMPIGLDSANPARPTNMQFLDDLPTDVAIGIIYMALEQNARDWELLQYDMRLGHGDEDRNRFRARQLDTVHKALGRRLVHALERSLEELKTQDPLLNEE